MAEAGARDQQNASKAAPARTPRAPAVDGSLVEAGGETLVGRQALAGPRFASPPAILALQRQVGNQAVLSLLRGRIPPARPTAPAGDEKHEPDADGVADRATDVLSPASTPAVQRMMTYKEFQKLTGQRYKKRFFETRKTGKKKQAKAEARAGSVSYEGLRVNHAGINKAFETYEAEPTLPNLVKLQDSITYWKAFNFIAAKDADSDAGELAATLDKVLAEIKLEVHAWTAKFGTGGPDESPAEAADTTKDEKPGAVKMPDYMREVGIAPGYYKDHLEGNKRAVFLLRQLYEKLDAGNLKNAQTIIAQLDTMSLPGFGLIRSLFLAHFASAAQLGDLVGTKAQTGELTDEEKEALKSYTAHSGPANAALRGVDLKAETTGKALQFRALVSALNKLPPFQGVVYRGQSPFPGMNEVWQPGGVIADLAFVSSAISLAGTEYYLNGGVAVMGGSKTYYSIIHAKTAVYITDRSLFTAESEALFKPGTRFQIKNIWTHVNGKVPPNAPHEVKSVLLRVGEFKTEGGKDKEHWEADRKMTVAFGNNDPGAFEKQKLAPVKVFELDEI